MYKSFTIKNYRCFSDLKIDGFKRINLFAGMNNIGKTSLLEALFLHCGAQNPILALQVNANRGMGFIKIELRPHVESPWITLFNDITKDIVFQGIDEHKIESTLKLSMIDKISVDLTSLGLDTTTEKRQESVITSSSSENILTCSYSRGQEKSEYELFFDANGIKCNPNPSNVLFPAFLMGTNVRMSFNEMAQRFSTLELHREKKLLLKALKILEPRLKDLILIMPNVSPILYGDIGLKRPVPLPLMGEGMVRMSNFIILIANAPDGVVLIDEIENGIHHTVLVKLWKVLYKAAQEFNTQIFATTHSFECIRAAHDAFSKTKKYDFSLIRLEKVKNVIKSIVYDKKTLATSIEHGFEVR